MSLKLKILITAVRLSGQRGYTHVTRDEIAAAANCGTGTINYHYGDINGLVRAVMRHAVEHRILAIVAQGLAERHPVATHAPMDLQQAAAHHLTV